MNHIIEAKVFNMIFAISARAVFRNPFLYIFLKTKSEIVFWETLGIVSQILGATKDALWVP